MRMYLFTTMSYPHNTRIDQSKTHVILKEALKDFDIADRR